MDLKEVFKILMEQELETSSIKKRIWKIIITALKNSGAVADIDNKSS